MPSAAEPPRRPLLRGHRQDDGRRRCNVCWALLPGDEPLHRCSCHRLPTPEKQYNPRHDPNADETVLAALRAAPPGLPVDLRYVLGTEDRYGINDVVDRLRAAGRRIIGCKPVGYMLLEDE